MVESWGYWFLWVVTVWQVKLSKICEREHWVEDSVVFCGGCGHFGANVYGILLGGGL